MCANPDIDHWKATRVDNQRWGGGGGCTLLRCHKCYVCHDVMFKCEQLVLNTRKRPVSTKHR